MARDENDFRVRPGRVRDSGGRPGAAARGRTASFVGQVHQAIARAGGNPNRLAGTGKGSGRFNARGRGAAAAAEAEGSRRLAPGRERRAIALETGGGEGAGGEAEPAAGRGSHPRVRQRQGGGRPPALSPAGRGDPRRREGPGLFRRARCRGRPGFRRARPGGSPPVPLHRLGRGRGRALPTRARPPAI